MKDQKGICSTYSHIKTVSAVTEPCAPTEWGDYNSLSSRRLGGSAGGFGLGVDGAFAPESWVRSASRPYLGPFDSRGFASFAGRFETAEDCRCYNSSSSWLCGFV